MTPKPGIYRSVPFAEYQAWDAINATFLTTLSRRSPWHAQHDRLNPKPDTPALCFGRALHSYILEPTTFDQNWVVCPACDRRTKEGKQVYETFLKTKGNRDEISDREMVEIMALAGEIRKQQCMNLVCGGQAEVSIVWKDKKTGLLCKRRLDYERQSGWNQFITDLKTSQDISRRAFSNDLARYGYALAAAFSIDGWRTLTGDDAIYNLLAVEKEYRIAKVWEPDEQAIAAGRADYQAAIQLAAECEKTGVWPAYGTEAELLEAPSWYLQLHGVGPHMILSDIERDSTPTEEDESDDYFGG